jgi:hypothetical protein
MTPGSKDKFTRRLFTAVMVGAFMACGVFLGIMRVEGLSTGDMVRAVSYGVLGFLMLWGVTSDR